MCSIKNCLFINNFDVSRFKKIFKDQEIKKNNSVYKIDTSVFKNRKLINSVYLDIDEDIKEKCYIYPKCKHELFGTYCVSDSLKEILKKNNIRFQLTKLYVTNTDDKYVYYKSSKKISFRYRYDCWLILDSKYMDYIKKEVSNYCYRFITGYCILHSYGNQEILEKPQEFPNFKNRFRFESIIEKNIPFKVYNDYENRYPEFEKFDCGKYGYFPVIQYITEYNLKNQV